MSTSVDFDLLVQKYYNPGVQAIVLMGSHARGEAGGLSDVDLLRIVDTGCNQETPDGTDLISNQLVVVSSHPVSEIETYFDRPELAVKWIAGLRSGRAIFDPSGIFRAIQSRAISFSWDAEMQTRANRWVSQSMVGWIEEAHKGLQGLETGDLGRLVNARFGLSWGLTRVMVVYRGILLSSDNAIFSDVDQVVGVNSTWAALRRTAFGVEDGSGYAPILRKQVVAGLRLYVLTASIVRSALQPADQALVQHTVILIENAKLTLPEEKYQDTMEQDLTSLLGDSR